MSTRDQTARQRRPLRAGFTLVELTGVLIILVLVAAMIIPLVGGSSGILSVDIGNGEQSAEAIVTQTTMQSIRDTLISTGTTTGLWADMGHIANRLPRTIGQMFDSTAPVAGTPSFDPVTKIGWRGPYLTQATGTYPDVTTSDWNARNFSATYGATGDPAMIDAWGNPIVLQVDFDVDGSITSLESLDTRLVSAGPNGTIDLDLTDRRTEAEYLAAYQNQLIDDVVLFVGITE
ncbi:MAG: hypothetical protein AAF483_02030 [Planctomycetota bacterium]